LQQLDELVDQQDDNDGWIPHHHLEWVFLGLLGRQPIPGSVL
jgi:hypothetical protein